MSAAGWLCLVFVLVVGIAASQAAMNSAALRFRRAAIWLAVAIGFLGVLEYSPLKDVLGEVDVWLDEIVGVQPK